MECGCRTIVHIYNYVESKVNTCKLREVTSGRGGLFDVSTTCCVTGTRRREDYREDKREGKEKRRQKKKKRRRKSMKRRKRQLMESILGHTHTRTEAHLHTPAKKHCQYDCN